LWVIAICLDPGQLLGNLGLRPLDLDDQQRLAIGVSGMGESLGRADAGAVHEFDRHGQDTRPDDVGDAGPATSLLSKPTSTGRAPSGLGRMRSHASVTTPS
jgi:hypothetical protein